MNSTSSDITDTAADVLSPSRPPRRSRRWQFARWLGANLYDLRLLLYESRLMLGVFAVLALISTTYIVANYPLSLPEALYETLRLFTFNTSLTFPRQDWVGQVIFFVTPLLGISLIFQGVLNLARLLLDKSSRRELWQVALASTYRDHVVVCGMGRVGFRVVSQLLEAGYDPVVIDHEWDSEFVGRVMARGVPVVLGDARDAAVLQQARVKRARAIVCAIDDDLVNTEIALTARALHPHIRTVLRIFNEDLDRSLERTLTDTVAFSASGIAAPTIAAAAVSREVDYVIPVGNTLLGITKIVIQRNSRLDEFVRKVESVEPFRIIDHRNAAGQAQRRGMLMRLNPGDRVTLIGLLPALEQLRVKNCADTKYEFMQPHMPLQHPDEQFDTVIVCGMGKVGIRVVHQLMQLQPRPRIVGVRLPGDAATLVRKTLPLENVTIVEGDARNPDVLAQAGLVRAFSVVAVTSDDLINLQVGLAARRVRPNVHLVLRTFSDVLAERLTEMFGIRTTYSTSALAGPTLAAASLVSGVRHAFYAGDQLFTAANITVKAGDALAGKTVEQLLDSQAESLFVLGVQRDAQVQTMEALPPVSMVIEVGQVLTLLGPIEAIQRLQGGGV